MKSEAVNVAECILMILLHVVTSNAHAKLQLPLTMPMAVPMLHIWAAAIFKCCVLDWLGAAWQFFMIVIGW